MPISLDPTKCDKTLAERGLDFEDAEAVLDGPVWEFIDSRTDYGEERTTTIGFLRKRMVVVVWTSRGEDRHIISMRKANERERGKYGRYLD